MNDKMVLDQVAEELRNRGYDAEVQEIAKNNENKVGVVIKKGGVGAIFYTDCFQNPIGAPASVLADEVESHMQKVDAMSPSGDDIETMLCDPDHVRGNLHIRLCNEAWNGERLKDAVKARVYDTDLLQYLTIDLPVPFGKGSVVVSESLLAMSGITVEEAWECANKNLDPDVENLRDLLAGLGCLGDPEPKVNISIISNKDRCYGASAILSKETLMAVCADMNADKIYLIPSSVHEFLALPDSEQTPEGLSGMIQSVNSVAVDKAEWLSDHPYLWDGCRLTSVNA